MTSRKLIPLMLMLLLLALFAGVPSAVASHARIVRLSAVTGDVRFAAKTHGDPLADSSAVWENAQLNLPIRQGYVLATDNGRAAVEFENGAMAFLKENTVLQFYDLSLDDGALTTRLVLLQGSASFHVNPVSGDYFSVTGGDFTVEANGRSTFRLDNYDDGSTVQDVSGRLSVLHKDQTTVLEKGQSLSMKAGEDSSLSVGRLPEPDEFDRWVSGQIDTVSNATAAALQYTSSPYYAPGFGSLYSYGSWFDCGGYGFGWRPFGAGFGWSPFTNGQWIFDPVFGWTWDSFEPWGWAPYHYGGWLFDSACGGWFYSSPLLYAFYPGSFQRIPTRRFPPVVHPPRVIYHPVTAVFVRNNNTIGIVPMHPLDARGKTPLNLNHWILSPTGANDLSGRAIAAELGQKWQTLKSAPKDAFSNGLATTGPPVRISRTVLESASATRVISTSRDSSIAYDPREHRFVNSNSAVSSASRGAKESLTDRERVAAAANRDGRNSAAVVPPATARNSTAPPPRMTVPPPAPRYSGGARGSSVGSTGGMWGGSRSSSAGTTMRSAPAPAPAAHASGGRPH